MPRPAELRDGVLARAPRSPERTLTRHQSWHLLCRLVLGLDSLCVRCGRGGYRVDVGFSRSHGGREECVLGAETEHAVGIGSAWLGRLSVAKSFLSHAIGEERSGDSAINQGFDQPLGY